MKIIFTQNDFKTGFYHKLKDEEIEILKSKKSAFKDFKQLFLDAFTYDWKSKKVNAIKGFWKLKNTKKERERIRKEFPKILKEEKRKQKELKNTIGVVIGFNDDVRTFPYKNFTFKEFKKICQEINK